jgi:dihydropyrimidinase
MPGVEPRFNLLYSQGVASGRISLPRFVDLIATNPARNFGMYPKKGTLLPGSDADIVLFDPHTQWTMGQQNSHSCNDWHAYEGIEVTGKIRKVFSRGELLIDGENCLGKKGRGRYVHRKLDWV